MCARLRCMYVGVCLMCGWVQQQHYRERKESDGGEMRERKEVGREGWKGEFSLAGKTGDMRFLS